MTTTESDTHADIHTGDIHTTAGKLADLRKRAEETLHPVGEAAVEKTHAKGKLTARERILALLDEDSFVELDALARHRSTTFNLQENRPVGDGVVTGADFVRELGLTPVPIPGVVARTVARGLTALPGSSLLPPITDWVEAVAQPSIVDTTKARELLGWTPRYNSLEALRATVHPDAEP